MLAARQCGEGAGKPRVCNQIITHAPTIILSTFAVQQKNLSSCNFDKDVATKFWKILLN